MRNPRKVRDRASIAKQAGYPKGSSKYDTRGSSSKRPERVVAASAAPIAESNIGNQLLRKMGYADAREID